MQELKAIFDKQQYPFVIYYYNIYDNFLSLDVIYIFGIVMSTGSQNFIVLLKILTLKHNLIQNKHIIFSSLIPK